MKTVVIIPAFNEETRIRAAILDAAMYADDVVVVDDCSHDETARVAFEAGAHVLQHVLNRGQGAALQTGTDYALQTLHADILVHFDADGQMQGADIPSLMAPIIADTADIVLGSRFLGKDAIDMPRARFLTLKAALAFTRLVSGLNISDPHCGMRALSRTFATQARFYQDRMAHASEVHDQIKMTKARHTSVPVSIRYTQESLQKGMTFRGGFTVLKDYFKHRFFGAL